MSSIEIFKTDIKSKQYAGYLIREMKELFPDFKISIDLDDHDKVLRVESRKRKVQSTEVINLLNKRNFYCEVMDY